MCVYGERELEDERGQRGSRHVSRAADVSVVSDYLCGYNKEKIQEILWETHERLCKDPMCEISMSMPYNVVLFKIEQSENGQK